METFTLAVPTMASKLAVIVVLPVETALANPAAVIVDTLVLLDAQVTRPVTSLFITG